MSRFSGKSDLADTVMMQVMYKKYPDMENSPLVSDLMASFNKFKEETGGKLYQNFKLKLTEHNVDKEIERSDFLTRTELPPKEGVNQRKKKYLYNYFGKEFKTLDALNKYGYYAKREIKFDTLLDLIPYFPHIVTVMTHTNGKKYVEITRESFVDIEYLNFREYGSESSLHDYYKKELQDFYNEVYIKYYYEGENK